MIFAPPFKRLRERRSAAFALIVVRAITEPVDHVSSVTGSCSPGSSQSPESLKHPCMWRDAGQSYAPEQTQTSGFAITRSAARPNLPCSSVRSLTSGLLRRRTRLRLLHKPRNVRRPQVLPRWSKQCQRLCGPQATRLLGQHRRSRCHSPRHRSHNHHHRLMRLMRLTLRPPLIPALPHHRQR